MSNKASFAKRILEWYDKHQRDLPWRAKKGQTPDPYYVLVSEIMLQQTQVKTVIPYFNRFLEKFPTINRLAEASLEQVFVLWSGLGYYTRAKNLHQCAKQIMQRGGVFPQDIKELKTLAGVGEYTANALLSIAFNKPVVPVDGNVERIVARLFAVQEALPQVRKKLKHLAETLNAGEEALKRPSAFAQALFDVGATICKPKAPLCLICPLTGHCKAYQLKCVDQLPRRQVKSVRPIRYGISFFILNQKKEVFLKKRAHHGLLRNTFELPGTEWQDNPVEPGQALQALGLKGEWVYKTKVKHVFSHFTLEVSLYSPANHVKNNVLSIPDGRWISLDDLQHHPCSSLLKKMITSSIPSLPTKVNT